MTRFLLLTQVKVKEYTNQMEDLLDVLHFEMSVAQAKYKDDTAQDYLSASILCVDDQIWLNIKNIHIKCFICKLDWKNLEQLTIKTVLSSWAYKLNLSNTMKIHSVFHVFKLLSVIINSFLG